MNRRRRTRGFSLIEILVVVVIIAIVSSIALLSLGLLGEDRELETEARRLAALVEVAQDEAMMQGREFGLEFMTDSYRFVEFDPLANQWVELFGDELFRLRQLPEDVEFDLYLEGKRILLEYDPVEIEDPDEESSMRTVGETYVPHILIFSSGDVTPFELAITRRPTDQSVTLEADLTGKIALVSEEDV
jgi:general secretion pathway protein H